MLAAEPRLKSLEVLRRLRDRGLTGGKSAVYALAKRLRPQAVRTICRFEGVAGEVSQHDFGEVQVEWTAGGRQKVVFFASRLKHSRFALMTWVADQRVETLVRTLAEHFDCLGGLPLMAVFDRPGTIVAKSAPRTGAALAWIPTFAEVTTRLGVAVEVCWPYRANQKGSVENLVGWVKGSFFKQRRFLDKQDLQMQLQAWHEEANEHRPSRATGRGAAGGGRAPPAPGQAACGGTRLAVPRAGGPDRHGDVGDEPLLGAGRGPGLRGDPAPVPRPRGDRGRALPGRAPAPARAQPRLQPGGPPRRPAGYRERQARPHVPETPAVAGTRTARRADPDRARACAAAALARRRRATARAVAVLWQRRPAGGLPGGGPGARRLPGRHRPRSHGRARLFASLPEVRP